MTNRITTAIDFDTKGGVRSLGQLRTEVKNTDGAFNKFKVAGSGAMEQVKANAATLALAGGAALVAFGAKAVNAFTDSAIAAGQFADATGLSTEQASQWNSVAADLGLSAETLQKSFLKMNKEIGEGGGLVEKYGLQLKRTAGGQADVNGTMLEAIEVIGGIKDPTERAAVAQEVFGRSYAEVAEIVLGDSDKIKAALESTSDAQIFDEDEVRKAREYRRVMDEFNDVITDLTMTVGEGLTPALSDAVENATTLTRSLEKIPGGGNAIGNGLTLLTGGFQGLSKSLLDAERGSHGAADGLGTYSTAARGAAGRSKALADAADESADGLEETGEEAKTAAEKLSDYRNRTNDAVGALEGAYDAGFDVNEMLAEQADAFEDVTDEVDELVDAFADLKDEMDIRDAWDDVVESAEDFAEAIRDVQEAETEHGRNSPEWIEANRKLEASLRDRVRAVINYIEQAGNIPTEVESEIRVLLDQGKVAEAEAVLRELERGRTSIITIQTRINNAPQSDFAIDPVSQIKRPKIDITQGGGYREFDDGGVVPGRKGAAQLAVVHGGETILPTHKSGGAGLGGITIMPGAIQVTSIGSPTPELERMIERAIDNVNRRQGRQR